MLRDYQVKALDLIRKEFQSGKKKVLLHLATGAGKTVCFSEVIKGAAAKEKRTLVLVRGRKLVDQASQRLFREKVNHGVLMAGHWNDRPQLPHQVASIDTLIARKLRPKADIVIIDEAHLAISDGYKEVLKDYDHAFVLSVTATPYVDTGLRHVADCVVNPITMNELVEQGYLVPFRYFAPSTPDLSDVHTQNGDYVNSELEGAMGKNNLTGRIVDHWRELASDRPTLLFAVNIRHSRTLVQKFCDAGISAEHCDADTPDEERVRVIERLERGETRVVSNVGIFCTGVDIPSVSAIIMARPTKSLNLFIQQSGRGTRLSPGKSDCIILDHAGNLLRLGLPTEEHEVDLDGKAVSQKNEKKTHVCKECFCVFVGATCPECKKPIPPAPIVEIEETDARLVEITQVDPVLRELRLLQREARNNGRKPAWVYYRLVERFSLEKATPHLPKWFLDRQTNPFSDSPFTARAKRPG